MRLVIPATFLMFATGCEEWERIFTRMHADDEVEDTAPAPLGCGDIEGTFVADVLEFQHDTDPGVVEDFGDYPDYTIVFDRRSERFEAMLLLDGQALVTTGTFGLIGDRIIFEAPFVEGMGTGPFALRCDYDGNALTLYGPATYRFDGTNPEDVDFVGILLAD